MRNKFYINTLTLLHLPTLLTFPLLYNKDIIVNLYNLHFLFFHIYFPIFLSNQTKIFSTFSFLHPFNQTHIKKTNFFLSSHLSIFLLIFYFLIFFFISPTKPTLNLLRE